MFKGVFKGVHFQNEKCDCIKYLKLVDPCSGSGHILVYAFDVLVQIYESKGYTRREAAKAILKNNLYALDIDERAYQLTYFSLMMKAREYHGRILDLGIRPNVYCIEESNPISRKQLEYFGTSMDSSEQKKAIQQMNELLDVFKDAKEYGSILNVPQLDYELLKRFIGDSEKGQLSFDAFAENSFGLDDAKNLINKLIEQAEVLSKKYWITCTNPPYFGSDSMGERLSKYVKKYYPLAKADLYSVFIEKCSSFGTQYGLQAMITMHSWMFLSSYEKFRGKLIQRKTILNMAHLGTRAFEEISGEIVQTTAWVMRSYCSNYQATYVRLVDEMSQAKKEMSYLSGKNRYIAEQDNYITIPGNPLAYWISEGFQKIFNEGDEITKFISSRDGLTTGKNDDFIKYFWEVSRTEIQFGCENVEQFWDSERKYAPLIKGGLYRKWYGNNWFVITYDRNSYNKLSNCGNKLPSREVYFFPYITWNRISTRMAFRYCEQGYLFESASLIAFSSKEDDLFYALAFTNSILSKAEMQLINPTTNMLTGYVDALKVPKHDMRRKCIELAKECVDLCRDDWNSKETSWDFLRHPLISVIAKNRLLFDDISNIDMSECFSCWESECDNRFKTLKNNEEELNRIFINAYEMQHELKSEVDEKDISVRRADLQADIKSFLSYAVGCMFGRYSIATDGLTYAGGKWDASKYARFIPDEDNVIPITDQKYMDDDIVGRLCEFLRVVYGDNSLETNLDFIANALGGKGSTSREIIRNYFLNDFFKDHCKIYQKRPIYWLFDSGKQNGFKALVYMHRWDKDSIGRVLVYLHKIQEKYEIEVRAIDAMLEHITDKRQQAAEEQRRDHLLKQIAEIKEYDEGLDHMTNEHIDIDLDDGVKVNYEKVQTDRNGKKFKILAPIK